MSRNGRAVVTETFSGNDIFEAKLAATVDAKLSALAGLASTPSHRTAVDVATRLGVLEDRQQEVERTVREMACVCQQLLRTFKDQTTKIVQERELTRQARSHYTDHFLRLEQEVLPELSHFANNLKRVEPRVAAQEDVLRNLTDTLVPQLQKEVAALQQQCDRRGADEESWDRQGSPNLIRASRSSHSSVVASDTTLILQHMVDESHIGLEAALEDIRMSVRDTLGAVHQARDKEQEGVRRLTDLENRVGQGIPVMPTLATPCSTVSSSSHAERRRIIKKVLCFRHLSQRQIDEVCAAFDTERHSRGHWVVEQGEHGDRFYVVLRGECRVLIDGQPRSTLGMHQWFGERALLFEEPRAATIEVLSMEAEFWCIGKSVFLGIVEGKMRSELMRRIELQDTQVTLRDLQRDRCVGVGTFGKVWRVKHRKEPHLQYALKRLPKQNGQLPEDLAKEFELVSQNDHPFMMHVFRALETARTVYVLGELITGGDMRQVFDVPEFAAAKGVTRTCAQFYISSLVSILDALRDRRILYRDFKPEHLMLDCQGYIKLIDFGTGMRLGEGMDRTYSVVGTPQYMAPEVAEASQDHRRGYGHSCDVWSVGVLFFELLFFKLPFGDDDPSWTPSSMQSCILKTVRKGLAIPASYMDADGQSLLQGLLTLDADVRLGSASCQELYAHPYFSVGGAPTDELFDDVRSRRLDAPVLGDTDAQYAAAGRSSHGARADEDSSGEFSEELPEGQRIPLAVPSTPSGRSPASSPTKTRRGGLLTVAKLPQAGELQALRGEVSKAQLACEGQAADIDALHRFQEQTETRLRSLEESVGAPAARVSQGSPEPRAHLGAVEAKAGRS